MPSGRQCMDILSAGCCSRLLPLVKRRPLACRGLRQFLPMGVQWAVKDSVYANEHCLCLLTAMLSPSMASCGVMSIVHPMGNLSSSTHMCT